ncbi:helix-turn-helix transcriptional regulator [Streptomyces profundus]|uniref:helix-turn-helix transcriptional regulator n=1 Tax=Streptomyces profundus TaxID=2867410 RepID=UPI001D16080C|nr:helix-turn-helix domain-containing protein [Streptomyces sp. MA3_2.13]UED86755.1 helix-turn-helix domain-containing protein [Streptomyces sp. MA3_2.13]
MTVSPLAAVVPHHAIRFLGHDTHEHEVPHLVHVVSGTAELVADGRRFPLRTQESAWLAPFVAHAVRVSEGGLVLGPLLEPSAAPPSPVRHLRQLPAVTRVMTAILGAAPATEPEIAPFRRALGDVLRSQLPQYLDVVEPRHPVARAIARDARRTRDTLDQLAHRHHMSARQVQRLFLAETGLAFARWRTRARLNTAIRELLAGAPAARAAERAGYATRSGLLRALARECGIATEDLHGDLREALLDTVA